MRIGVKSLLVAAGFALGASAMAPSIAGLVQKKPPFFASISAGKARMRTGPARSYPASWLYQRADLPVKVLDVYDKGQWYKVEDPGGTQGWMMGTLVSENRTAVVLGTVADLRDSPRDGGRILWRAAPGVIGRLSKCSRGWCHLDVRGRGGFVEANHLWGVEPGEELP
ncbi:SH3 domain-containing protein [Sphingomonas sp. RB3P16]|uniref:SH3 domain-containing protein n=1 Tax=Parasphingomonas frigoris TaxID=3096163 RepID=UPI002FC8ED21